MTLSVEDEGLAAEYALGTLDADERASLAARRSRERELDAEIGAWEARLGALMETAPARAPPADLYPRIEARLGGVVVDMAERFRARAARWRAAAVGAGALAAGLAAALAVVTTTAPPRRFVAVLQKSPEAPAFAMTVDVDKLEFSVVPVAADAPTGKSYELWLIAGSQAPKSLGLIDARAQSAGRRLAAAPGDVRDALYAVTLEPQGGSPSGKPTSSPILFGKLVPVGP